MLHCTSKWLLLKFLAGFCLSLDYAWPLHSKSRVESSGKQMNGFPVCVTEAHTSQFGHTLSCPDQETPARETGHNDRVTED
ncbi:hypothetical protein SAMN05444515_10837 [Ectothiorhodospira marina]|uniref:Secreted protein n=1 Tax=Ectothiorhodospira marina TaxID=1396821 RepID=A0A1H7LSX9_9GAMM|nr:hypothetical protein SAMN05444515_10837 [Ectothiorhodospira marina]